MSILGSYGFASCYCLPACPDYPRMVEYCSDSKAAAQLNKNLTAILIEKAQNNRTVAIGYEAEEQYAKVMERGEGENYMYFEHFKPLLYSLVSIIDFALSSSLILNHNLYYQGSINGLNVFPTFCALNAI